MRTSKTPTTQGKKSTTGVRRRLLLILASVACVLLLFVVLRAKRASLGESSASAIQNEPIAPQKRKVLFVTSEFRGVDATGGIGAAFYRLAKLLVSNGIDVTVAYVSYPYCVQPNVATHVEHNGHKYPIPKHKLEYPHRCQFDEWVEKYKQANINLELVRNDESQQVEHIHDHDCLPMRQSYKAYLWLKQRAQEFDVVHFHDYLGLSYYSMMAKQQGLLRAPLLVLQAHGTQWFVHQAQSIAPQNACHLMTKHMEEQSIRMAEYLTAPSNFYLKWLFMNFEKSGGNVMPNVMLGEEVKFVLNEDARPATTLVYFGRFAAVKGIHTFLQALELLAKEETIVQRIVFLGTREADNEFTDEFFERESKKWKWGYDLVLNKNTAECMMYLSDPGRVAVIPSTVETSSYVVQEMLYHHLPFLAASAGGVPELIEDDFHESNLFEPNNPLALLKLIQKVEKQVPCPKSKLNQYQVRQKWVQWHAQLPASIEMPRAASTLDIVIATMNPTSSNAWLIETKRMLAKVATIIIVGMGPPSATDLPNVQRVSKYSLSLSAAWNLGASVGTSTHALFLTDWEQVEIDIPSILSAIQSAHHIDMFVGFEQTQNVNRTLFLGAARESAYFGNSLAGSAMIVKRQSFATFQSNLLYPSCIFEHYILSQQQQQVQVIPEAIIIKHKHVAMLEQQACLSSMRQLLNIK